ncbi:protein of unknown function [Maridesulfovibrio hydrothermalis AM13 = DSM 14728]|uniref:Uncharacterized protein n=1 Tax=Maridesulfovibrio hydrothermalis AM13 = DSM 14728 TaxID=1121451 RepID=L0R813_9BACT|nr:protein of unknown function [Maridesulfovibrio hydrothermalis AM13 = DSM 14728]
MVSCEKRKINNKIFKVEKDLTDISFYLVSICSPEMPKNEYLS